MLMYEHILEEEWTREGHIANDVIGNMWDYNFLNHHVRS
jgi:hypothetical protein